MQLKELFDWFTKKVVCSDEIYGEDTLASHRVTCESFRLAKRKRLEYEFGKRYDVAFYKNKDAKDNGKPILLALEFENNPAWEEVEWDFLKLVRSNAQMKVGVFHTWSAKKEKTAKMSIKRYKEKMLKIVLDREKHHGKWLLILGAAFEQGKRWRTWYSGYTLEKRRWSKVGEMDLPAIGPE